MSPLFKYKSIRNRIIFVMSLGFTIAFAAIFITIVVTYNLEFNKERNSNLYKVSNVLSKEIQQNISNIISDGSFILQSLNELAPELRENFASKYIQRNSVIKGIFAIAQSRFIEGVHTDENYVEDYMFFYFVKGKTNNYAIDVFESIDKAMSSDFYLKNTENRAATMQMPHTYSAEMGRTNVVTFIYNITGNHEGILGIDIDVNALMQSKMDLEEFKELTAFLIDKKGSIVATTIPRLDKYGASILEAVNDTSIYLLDNKVTTEVIHKRESFTEHIIPMSLENIDTELFYFAAIEPPARVLVYNSFAQTILIAMFVISIFSFIMIVVYGTSTTNPYIEIGKYAYMLSEGKISIQEIKPKYHDSEKLGVSLNKLKAFLVQIVGVINLVADDKATDKIHTNGEDNEIANSVNNLIDKLHSRKMENEMRRKELEKNNWIRENLSEFSDLIRQSSENFKALSGKVVKNIVDVLHANQVGLFIIKEDEAKPYLSLVASYAYNREKFLKKRVEFGEGMLGAVAVEKMTIHLSKLPDNYLEIESGTGGAQPKNLLIVPLKFEEKIYGVIEIASFNKFKAIQIEFAEKVSEVIASSLSILSINEKNEQLLLYSQEQAKQLAEKERHLEEYIFKLEDAQLQTEKREVELKGVLDAIKLTLCVAEYNIEGDMEDINQKMLNLFQSKKESLVGINHRQLTSMSNDEKAFAAFWDDLRKGEHKTKEGHVLLPDGNEIWIQENFIPILDNNGKAVKVLNIVIDNTENKVLEREYQKLLESI